MYRFKKRKLFWLQGGALQSIFTPTVKEITVIKRYG